MPTRIKAGTATTGGVFEPDTAGTLELQTGSTPTTALAIDASQNVGIGTSSPTGSWSGTKLALNTGDINFQRTDAAQNIIWGATASYSYISGNASSNVMAFGTANTERMRITSGGDLLVGTTNTDPIGANVNGIYIRPGLASSFVATSDDVLKIMRRTSTGTLIQFFYNGATTVGNISTNGTTTAYNTTSDYRLKENIAPMTGALATVTQLKPVTYTWKNTGETGQGFIAHELQSVVPDCVSGEKDGVETYIDEEGNEQTRPVYQGVDTSFLVATLTAAIQELKAELDTVKSELATLKGSA